jgi:4-amino-4-deoxy-L-arabinose transferase-like glycosyltransferase
MVSRTIRSEPKGLVEEIEARLDQGIREVRSYMASPEGRKVRRRVAQALIFGAPLLFRTRFIRRHPVGRVLGLVGGAALVVKLAEALRDWEPIEELAEDLGLKEEDDLG